MDEIMDITDYIQDAAGQTAEVIWGYGTDPNLGEDLCVTVIATGFDATTSKSVTQAEGPKKIWLHSNDKGEEQTTSPANEAEQTEPFLKQGEEPATDVDRNKWDVNMPQRELFPTPESTTTSDTDIPSTEKLADLPQDSLKHAEAQENNEPELNQDLPETPREEEVSTNEEFIIYNLDEVPEPDDLTADVAKNGDTPEEPESNQFQMAEDNTAEQASPSAQPSREAFAERQRQITRSLAEFKSKLNLPGRIADLENEPAYKRRNVSIDDTPQSSDSQVSRMHLSEEFDEEGNRRVELRNDNSFLHDNVD